MVDARAKGLLETTHQNGKLRLAAVLTIAPFLVVLLAKRGVDDPLLRIGIGVVAAIFLFVGAFYALYSVRCPKCKLRWVWWALKTQPHSGWGRWLYEFTECPQCKYSNH